MPASTCRAARRAGAPANRANLDVSRRTYPAVAALAAAASEGRRRARRRRLGARRVAAAEQLGVAASSAAHRSRRRVTRSMSSVRDLTCASRRPRSPGRSGPGSHLFLGPEGDPRGTGRPADRRLPRPPGLLPPGRQVGDQRPRPGVPGRAGADLVGGRRRQAGLRPRRGRDRRSLLPRGRPESGRSTATRSICTSSCSRPRGPRWSRAVRRSSRPTSARSAALAMGPCTSRSSRRSTSGPGGSCARVARARSHQRRRELPRAGRRRRLPARQLDPAAARRPPADLGAQHVGALQASTAARAP